MSATEFVRIKNETGSSKWFKLSDGNHEIVSIPLTVYSFVFGEEDPNLIDPGDDQISLSSSMFSTNGTVFDNFDTAIWVRLANNQEIKFFRGQGNLRTLS